MRRTDALHSLRGRTAAPLVYRAANTLGLSHERGGPNKSTRKAQHVWLLPLLGAGERTEGKQGDEEDTR